MILTILAVGAWIWLGFGAWWFMGGEHDLPLPLYVLLWPVAVLTSDRWAEWTKDVRPKRKKDS